MADIKPFAPVKLVCGIIAGSTDMFRIAENRLAASYGPVDARGPRVPFLDTAYYTGEMGPGLSRMFLAFRDLICPDRLPDIKIETNALEDELREKSGAGGRTVNLDPGIVTGAALVMATAKDFAHRPPLQKGIYAHLELLFTKAGVKRLEWTYPDFRTDEHIPFFMAVRKSYLEALIPRVKPLR
ncbi:MAG: DUF4416 family protein [Candidatus Aminicenantes bacterium]|nr:DUF4416 family protein [Candidatus Aminicenantes bacterium]